MAEIMTVEVQPRDRAGKGSARAARREGLVPAVIYGDKKSPELITLTRNELVRLIRRGVPAVRRQRNGDDLLRHA